MMEARTAIENSRLYHDLNSLSKLRGENDSVEAIREAAVQFESVFYGMMMKSMRDANKAIIDKPMFDSPALDLFQDMYDKQMSLNVGGLQQSKLGLADILVEQLTAGRVSDKGDIKDDAVKASNFEQLPKKYDHYNGGISMQQATELKQQNPVARTQGSEEQDYAVETVWIGTSEERPKAVVETEQQSKGADYSSPLSFIKSLLPHAKTVAHKLGVDPALLLAQAALETGWGKFVMRKLDGISSNNLFGIKADTQWQGDAAVVSTLEYRQGELRQERAAFKAYETPAQAFGDYVELISTKPRYQAAREVSHKPYEYLKELQSAGYATDPDYADKIHQIYRSETFSSALESSADAVSLTR